ncbi:head-closure protein [Vibrio phage 1.077.O._10N.261.45.A10]|nr:head-closure protein [Vibrio phage 1.077.O._10N.261.45.A10]
MGVNRGSVDRFAPTRGLVTEANKGEFPQDAAVDLDNVTILQDGTVMRRRGMCIEPGGDIEDAAYPLDVLARDNASVGYYLWKNVGESGIDYAVLQFADRVIIKENTLPLSEATVKLTVDLGAAPWVRPFQTAADAQCEFIADRQFLIITNKWCNAALVYNNQAGPTPVLFAEELTPFIRVEKALAPEVKSFTYGATITPEQEFDLRNGGWPYTTIIATDSVGTNATKGDPVRNCLTVLGEYPSSSVLFNGCKLREAVSENAIGAFDPFKVQSVNFGQGLAPVGKFTTEFHKLAVGPRLTEMSDSETGSGIISADPPPVFSVDTRLQAVCLHAGRAFYAAKRYDGQDIIMMSRLYDSMFVGQSVGERSLEKCYQAADPTAEIVNDLIATDGITMAPSGTGDIFKLVEFGQGVIVFAQQGVWLLGGNSQLTGITATNFRFVQVDDEPVLGPRSVVLAGDNLLYMSRSGIKALAYDEQGNLTSANITETTIDSVYRGFNLGALGLAQGLYDENERNVFWTIPGTGNAAGKFKADCTEVLVLSLDIQGFYLYSIRSDVGGFYPRLLFPIQAEQTETDVFQEAITTIGGDPITTVGGDPLTVEIEVTVQDVPTLGFAAVRDDGTNFAVEYVRPCDDTFYDFSYLGGTNGIPAEGVDYTSYIEFAYLYPSTKNVAIMAPYVNSWFLNKRPAEINKISIVYPT